MHSHRWLLFVCLSTHRVRSLIPSDSCWLQYLLNKKEGIVHPMGTIFSSVWICVCCSGEFLWEQDSVCDSQNKLVCVDGWCVFHCFWKQWTQIYQLHTRKNSLVETNVVFRCTNLIVCYGLFQIQIRVWLCCDQASASLCLADIPRFFLFFFCWKFVFRRSVWKMRHRESDTDRANRTRGSDSCHLILGWLRWDLRQLPVAVQVVHRVKANERCCSPQQFQPDGWTTSVQMTSV